MGSGGSTSRREVGVRANPGFNFQQENWRVDLPNMTLQYMVRGALTRRRHSVSVRLKRAAPEFAFISGGAPLFERPSCLATLSGVGRERAFGMASEKYNYRAFVRVHSDSVEVHVYSRSGGRSHETKIVRSRSNEVRLLKPDEREACF